MDWHVGPRIRCDIIVFSGINMSGERRVVEIHPVGGRQGDIKTEDIKSLAIVAPIGTRVIFATDPTEQWEEGSWRAVQIKAGNCFKTKDGLTAIRIPDVDWLDANDARRTDPEFQASFEQVSRVADGTEWTFGRSGARPIKANIKTIRVEKI